LDIRHFTRGFIQPQSAHFFGVGIEIRANTMHVHGMSADIDQLKRNRAKVFMIAAGLFLLGSQDPDMGDLFAGHGADHHELRQARISVETDRVEAAAERAAELAERAAVLAERAAEAAERASERR
jgi:hypothetical protein